MQVALDTMESAVRLIDDLAGLSDTSRFAELALAGLARLINCDLLTYEEIDQPAEFGPTRYRISLSLPSFGCFVFHRDGRDFTDVERATLAALRDPLTHAVERAGRRPAGLTDRETLVLELVALGWTNVAIARRLGTSPRTVAKHLEHIYRKLGVSGRAAAVGRGLADYASANGIHPGRVGVVP